MIRNSLYIKNILEFLFIFSVRIMYCRIEWEWRSMYLIMRYIYDSYNKNWTNMIQIFGLLILCNLLSLWYVTQYDIIKNNLLLYFSIISWIKAGLFFLTWRFYCLRFLVRSLRFFCVYKYKNRCNYQLYCVDFSSTTWEQKIGVYTLKFVICASRLSWIN